MKKILCLILAVILLLAVPVCAEDSYTLITKNGVNEVVTPFQATKGSVKFPTVIDGVQITKVGDFACYESYEVTDVTIPSGITEIGRSAFTNIYITDIVIPEGVTKIGNRAFALCAKLENISIPSTLKYVEAYAFWRTPWYDNQPMGHVIVGDGAYIGYKGNETEISIPEGTKTIAGATFMNKIKVQKITVPASVEWIGDYAFKNCRSLTLFVKDGSYAMNYAIANNLKYQTY